MGTQAFLLLAMTAAAAASDRLELSNLEPEEHHGSIPIYDRPDSHDTKDHAPLHVPEHEHHEPVREQKVPDPLDPVKLPPVIPNDMSKPILILGKLPRGSPPYPFSPFDDGTCSMRHLLWPCPNRCSLEWNPVYAADREAKRVVTFINCCAWRWHVCHYKKRLIYLGRGNPNICPKDMPKDWPNVWSKSRLPKGFSKDWPQQWKDNYRTEWPKDWPQEWKDNFGKEWPKDWPNEWQNNWSGSKDWPSH